MIDITHKNTTLRTAVAQAIVKVSSEDTIKAIFQKTVPKGDVFEMSKAAGLLGIKKTPYLLPDCHPLPIEYTSVKYDIDGKNIQIIMTVKTIYKTGVEVEAMHGASIVALNMYDMLKPIDKSVEIHSIKLISKNGGKSDFADKKLPTISAAVFVCSDTISAGRKEDKAGKEIIKKLEKSNIEIKLYEILPDEIDSIRDAAISAQEQGVRLIIFTGGTGMSKRDVTREALSPILERTIPGVEEHIRAYGQARMPYSMLSRSLAGTLKDSLILALPGSTNGARESMDAIFPEILHIYKIFAGSTHKNV